MGRQISGHNAHIGFWLYKMHNSCEDIHCGHYIKMPDIIHKEILIYFLFDLKLIGEVFKGFQRFFFYDNWIDPDFF